jgi:hypothetical protein
MFGGVGILLSSRSSSPDFLFTGGAELAQLRRLEGKRKRCEIEGYSLLHCTTIHGRFSSSSSYGKYICCRKSPLQLTAVGGVVLSWGGRASRCQGKQALADDLQTLGLFECTNSPPFYTVTVQNMNKTNGRSGVVRFLGLCIPDLMARYLRSAVWRAVSWSSHLLAPPFPPPLTTEGVLEQT